MAKFGQSPKYDDEIRVVRKKSRKLILKILEKKPLLRDEISSAIKKELPKNCVDNILCICNYGDSKPEWMHQVRWALTDLRRAEHIQYNPETRKYSLMEY